MLKDKEKKALESLKQTYLKNREEKTREAKNRFFGFFLVSKGRKLKKKKKKVISINEYEDTPLIKRSIVKDKVKFEKYKILKNY